jgi:hypothetical protein
MTTDMAKWFARRDPQSALGQNQEFSNPHKK